MSKASIGSLVYQVERILLSMLEPGRSKYRDKLANGGRPLRGIIYSYSTLHTYLNVCCHFAKWVCHEYDCRTLAEARQYVPVYLQQRKDAGYSAWTIKKDACALSKLYQCDSYHDFGIAFDPCERQNRVKNRTDSWKDHPEKYAENKDLYELCVSLGVRHKELIRLTIDDFTFDKHGRLRVNIRQGKGGRPRYIIPLNDAPLAAYLKAMVRGDQYLFRNPPESAPIHFWRGEHARMKYAQLARPIEEIPRSERYYCRKDKKGTIYDKRAMLIVSLDLGHNRLNVVTNYLS